ncbi:MAG: biosynthetic arginine decarboxylase [Acidobacteriia bacterium]|nr:biosynthetic arginine decarboxylase [Terriglobia bacterium]
MNPLPAETQLMPSSETTDLVSKLYGVENWGAGYFQVSQKGNLSVTPTKNPHLQVDVYDVVCELARRKVGTPILLRFPQMLECQVTDLHEAFLNSINEFHYGGGHLGVFPTKVNQKLDVIESLLHTGAKYRYGLEVGSKAELALAVAMPLSPGALIVCNGNKDELFVRSALLCQKLQKPSIVVIEDIEDLKMTLSLAEKLELEAQLGIRVKLYTRGSGKWEESGGEIAKFGLNTIQLVKALHHLREVGHQQDLKMLHFHIGSQITNIKRIKAAVKEAARVFCKVNKMGFNVQYLNVGGGLGVDYDGSRTASECSVNYTIQEFANDVIYTVREVCLSENVTEPIVVTESGRAVVAYHSMLITDVRQAVSPGASAAALIEMANGTKSEPVRELVDLARDINAKNFMEYYHDALAHREEFIALFDLGFLDLEEKAKGEQLFWDICRKAVKFSKSMKDRPEEFEDLEKLLSSKYICNFSLFQSAIDIWALDQLVPIMPIHRLNEIPTEYGTLCDVTCDSDGSIDKFVDVRDTKESLELHSLNDTPYYIALLLVGAYQEAIGDLHNLFGAVNEVSVVVDESGRFHFRKIVRGEVVRQVLSYMGYDVDTLLQLLGNSVSRLRQEGLLKDEDEHELLANYSRLLDSYTYLS